MNQNVVLLLQDLRRLRQQKLRASQRSSQERLTTHTVLSNRPTEPFDFAFNGLQGNRIEYYIYVSNEDEAAPLREFFNIRRPDDAVVMDIVAPRQNEEVMQFIAQYPYP